MKICADRKKPIINSMQAGPLICGGGRSCSDPRRKLTEEKEDVWLRKREEEKKVTQA